MSIPVTQPDSKPPGTRGSLARSLIAVILGTLVLRIAAQTMGQMLQFYFAAIDRDHYQLSHTTSGLITASFFVTEVVGALYLGALSDRYGRRLFILLGPLFGALGVQITSLTVAIWLLVFTRLLEGLSTASSVPATLGYISEATSGRPNLRARIVGLFELSFAGGFVLGALVAGQVWDRFGGPATIAGIQLISPAFSINTLIYLAALGIFVWGLRDFKRRKRPANPNSESEAARLFKVLHSRRVWRFAPAWLAVNSIFGIWINHSARLFTGKDQYPGQLLTGNYSAPEFTTGVALFGVIFGGGLLGWSFFLGRYRKTNVMLLGTGALFVTLTVVYALNHLSSFSDPLYYPLLAGLLIGVAVMSAFTPAALVYLADVTEGHKADRGSIMGLYSFFLGIGQVIGTTLGGRFATWNGVDGLLLLSAVLGVITAVTLALLRREESTATA